MNGYYIYNTVTGILEFHQKLESANAASDENTVMVTGVLNDKTLVTSKIEGGVLVTDPVKLSEYNNSTQTVEALSKRKQLLENNVDVYVMNALRWADLTEAQQTDITNYRRALLDITDQEGYPATITWPELPSWMN